jgi:hypothetical protein
MFKTIVKIPAKSILNIPQRLICATQTEIRVENLKTQPIKVLCEEEPNATRPQIKLSII